MIFENFRCGDVRETFESQRSRDCRWGGTKLVFEVPTTSVLSYEAADNGTVRNLLETKKSIE